MASLKATFSLPKELVGQFVKRVPVRERSRYVVDALEDKLRERDQLLACACETAQPSRALRSLERDWDVLTAKSRSPGMTPCRGEL